MQWLWGGYSVSGTTLNRFFSLHYLLPFILVGLVILHIWALHVVGQNNPTGLDIKTHSDAVPMTPHAVAKDAVGMAAFFVLLAWFVFFLPDYLGHSDNYIEANPLVTPAHIVPEWYFLPFYAILRAIPSKLGGVIAMFASVLILAFVPWLDTSRVRSSKYRPVYKWFFWLFAISCLALGYLGAKPAEGVYVFWARIFTAYYFLRFLVVMPILGVMETPTAMPRSITEDVLGKHVEPEPQVLAAPAPEKAKERQHHDQQSAQALAAQLPSWRWPRPHPPRGLGRDRGRARDDPAPEVDLRRHFPGSSTKPSCSAASRSTRKSARPATASTASRSATSSSVAGRSSPRKPSRNSPATGPTRSSTAPTTRARCSSASRGSPIRCSALTATRRRRARRRTAHCPPTSR